MYYTLQNAIDIIFHSKESGFKQGRRQGFSLSSLYQMDQHIFTTNSVLNKQAYGCRIQLILLTKFIEYNSDTPQDHTFRMSQIRFSLFGVSNSLTT